MKILIKNLNEAKNFFKKLKNKIISKRIILLVGNLGAGKTTYAKLIAKEFKIKEPIQSPTFILWQKYKFKFRHKEFYLNHLDLYRINKPQEILKLDLKKELKKSENVFLIEWGEKIEKYLKRKKIKFLKVEIKILNKNQRLLKLNEGGFN